MTRERVLESVNGEVEVSLPGKEGMAVLALKNNSLVVICQKGR